MFATDAIVLKKSHIRDGEFLYHLFTRDFGKVRAWANKKKYFLPVDHGSILHCLISTKRGRNTLESVKVTRVIHPEELDYRSLVNVLLCLQHISLLHPEWISNPLLFDDYITSLPFFEQKETNARSVEYFLLKILKNSGIARERDDIIESDDFKKIFRHIDCYPLRTFHTMKGVHESVIREIRLTNQTCLIPYLT